MLHAHDATERQSYYDRLYAQLLHDGTSAGAALTLVLEAYLDGKPSGTTKRKISRRDRDSQFWTSEAVNACSRDTWRSGEMVLALARYLGQEAVVVRGLLDRAVTHAPETLIRAVRYSGQVLNAQSAHRGELRRAASLSGEIAELCEILNVFDHAYRDRLEAVERCRLPLVDLSPFELLLYASLRAFETWVPRHLPGTAVPSDDDGMQILWDAINDILTWKLSTAPEGALRLTDDDIARAVSEHLSPVHFPSPTNKTPKSAVREAFDCLLASQLELNSFVSRSADAFSYDDSIRFARNDRTLEIKQHDPSIRATWCRDGDRLARLHGYWFYRALNEFAASDIARETIGHAENHEANRLAYIRATRSRLRLTEVYGASDSVTAESGEKADLFQALLSIELMSAFFAQEFLAPFATFLDETGSARQALGLLAMDGLRAGQVRFPLTWSDRAAKVKNITGWTVNAENPRGSERLAAAILDFWTTDWVAFAARLQRGEPGLAPDLFERPILKLGQTLVQLPWVVAFQNNSTAAINNLKRLGARRGETTSETRRIELRLAALFEARGFGVLTNWNPPANDDGNAGEVDLVCFRDGIVLVVEVKSTYMRRSQRDAFVHETTTLRKAGLQLRRKVAAVQRMLASGGEEAARLGWDSDSQASVQGWIVDTSIECDHRRFDGFLKVSFEEVLIALRGDRHLLDDPEGIISGQLREIKHPAEARAASDTLYPEGFSAARFLSVIEDQLVWAKPPHES